MAGKLLNIKEVALNKHCGKLKSNCFEIRHAPYNNRWNLDKLICYQNTNYKNKKPNI